jgi:hypothetical protein
MTKSSMASTCSSAIGRFDGHGSPPVQYEAHSPMQHVQGYIGSHWTPPLGNFSLLIAPAATRATANKTTTTKNVLKRLAILMAVAVRWYNTARIAQ